MSFKMLDVLSLSEATTENVSLVPTQKYFKPVLVITAPMNQDTSKLIGADWAFDQFGNPQNFEGTIKLNVELPRASLILAGKVSGSLKVVTEAVKHFSVFRQEKAGMRVKIRCHLAEDKDQLASLLDFLSRLNKEAYSVEISPETLFTAGSEAVPQTAGAVVHPFKIPMGRKTACEGNIMTMPTGGGYISAWEFKGVGLTLTPAGGRQANDASHVHHSEKMALESAAEELLSFVKFDLKPDAKEVVPISLLCDWIFELAPALRKEPPKAAVQ